MLTAGEVREIVRSGLDVANRARAQIRRPIGSQARVTVSVVDTNGVILGIARTRDAPVFGTDVSLQKARTAAFFSNANAAADLTAAPNTIYRNADGSASGVQITIGDYVTDVRNFLGLPTALADGAFAFSDRAGGNLSRPFFPGSLLEPLYRRPAAGPGEERSCNPRSVRRRDRPRYGHGLYQHRPPWSYSQRDTDLPRQRADL